MRRWHKFFRLSCADRCLLINSGLLLGGIRVGLWLLPFRKVQRLLQKTARMFPEPRRLHQASIDRVAWAVTVASRYVPMGTCLIQALAAQALLEWRGHTASLYIGVAKGAAGQLEAHAWVEAEGQIVVGDTDDRSHFTPLPPLEGDKR
jgi:Transglutaminase-like superfamily